MEHDRHIFYQQTNLQAGTYEVRASADLPSTDTVVHAWQISPTNSWVGSNDDSFTSNCDNPPLIPDGGSCHSFTLAQPASIVFFVHRRHNTASGDTTIELENMSTSTTVWSFQASVGGEVIDSGPSGADVEWDARETLHAAVTEVLPGPTQDDDWVGGMLAPVMLVLAGPEKLVGYGVGSPQAISLIGTQGPVIGGQPSVYLPVGSDAIPVEPAGSKHQFVVGTDYWVDFQVTPWIIGNGTLDLYLNDASKGSQHDEDGDGLGDVLEQALGTCWEFAPGCPIPKDSDGDGLWDNWETIGGCTFFGCSLPTADAINFAYGGADPLVKDLFVQIDWERPATYDPNTDQWTTHTVQRSLLAELTETIAEAYARPLSSVDHPKPVIQLHFDYGQVAFGSAGGNEGPKVSEGDGARFCQSDKPAAACTLQPLSCNVDADCLGTQSCAQGSCECADDFECPMSTVCMESVCRPDGCAGHPCIHDDDAHVYDPALGPGSVNGDFVVSDRYNLETVLRGAPGGTFAFMPRNRRGLFVELWMGGLSDVNAAKFFSWSTCCAIGQDCYDPALERYYGTDCKDVFPGYVLWDGGSHVMAGQASCGGVSCGVAAAPTMMHELGHALRLGHGPPELDAATSCVVDRDCFVLTGEATYCVAGQCMVTGNRLPNHVSVMSYSYDTVPVDANGNIDFSSGLRPTLQIMQDVGPCDALCVAVGDPACKLPPELAGGLLPTDPCCYDDRCVDGGLDESVGVGDMYDADGNDYTENRAFQLSRVCGGGVSPVHPALPDPAVDWDDDGIEDVAHVARALLEQPSCHSGGPGNGYFRAIPDIDEWAFVDLVGFQLFGLNLLFSVGSNGYCGANEGVPCPAGYACERGFCRIGWVPGLPVDFAGLDEPAP